MKATILSGFMLVLLLRVCSAFGAMNSLVDDDGPADFSTIGDAIAASVNGDTVFVKAPFGVHQKTPIPLPLSTPQSLLKNSSPMDGSMISWTYSFHL